MDNLQHIDDLLKKSASSFEYAEVGANDWLAVEKKLRHRKNRIYALWFFLALVFVSSSILLINKTSPEQDQPISQNNTLDSNSESVDLLDNSKEQSNNLTTPSNVPEASKIQVIEQTQDVFNNTTSTTTLNEADVINKLVTSSDELPKDIPTLSPKSDIEPIKVENTTIDSKIDKVPNLVQEESPITTNSNLEGPIDNSTSSPIVTNNSPKPKVKSSTGTDKTKTHTAGHWEAGFSFTPSISNKKITENATLAGLIHKNYYDKALSSEKSSFSNSAGLNVQYHLPNGIFLATGAFISQRTESVNYDYTIDSVPINNNNTISGYKPQTPEPIKYSGSNSYHFMEIPLNIGYKTAISSNFELRSQVGMSYLLLFSQTGKKADFNSLSLKDVAEFSLNKNNLALNTKVGVYWNKKHFTIGAEPIFSLNLNNLNVTETSAIIVKPYSYGFNISTNYKFIK